MESFKILEPMLCSSRVFSPFREESGDEELAVLPRHTKVIVTGNNRTKSVLVGLQGVVKKAVGLGGWHWLVLKNGVEVKLQRNALSVLEHPTGNEVNFDSSSGSDICERDNDFSTTMEFSKVNKPKVRCTKPWAPSMSLKSIKRSSYKEVQSNILAHSTRVNLSRLSTSALWRYWTTFNLGSMKSNHPSREQLIRAVQQHFMLQQVDEVEAIVGFIRAARSLRSAGSRRE